jgi:hypothetical protein
MSTFIIWALRFNTASFVVGTTAVCKHLVTDTARFSAFSFAKCQTNDLQNTSSLRIIQLGSQSQLV